MSIHHKEQGFTLVEVMVTLIVTGLLIGVVAGFMVSGLSRSAIDSVRIDMLNEAHIALDIMTNDIRLSAVADDNNRWADPNAPNPGDQYSWQSDADTLVLATAAEDTSKNILWADASKYISHKNNTVYFVSGGTLYKRILASPVANNAAKTTCPKASATASCPADKEFIHYVTSLSLKYYDAENVEVIPSNARSIQASVTLSTKRGGQTVSVSYSTRMVFRNE